MSVNLIFKIAAVGILVSVISQVRGGRFFGCSGCMRRVEVWQKAALRVSFAYGCVLVFFVHGKDIKNNSYSFFDVSKEMLAVF